LVVAVYVAGVVIPFKLNEPFALSTVYVAPDAVIATSPLSPSLTPPASFHEAPPLASLVKTFPAPFVTWSYLNPPTKCNELSGVSVFIPTFKVFAVFFNIATSASSSIISSLPLLIC